MPVIEQFLLASLAALLLLLGGQSAMAAAPSASPELVMQHLLKDGTIDTAGEMYAAVSQGMMLYALCPEEYEVNEEKRAFADRAYARAVRNYMQAFADAHMRLMRKQPPPEVIALYSAHIRDHQLRAKRLVQQAVQNTRKQCKDISMRQLNQFMERYRENEDLYVRQQQGDEDARRASSQGLVD